MNNLEISIEKSRLEIEFIHQFITSSYWGKGRTLEETKICIENSLNFGVYVSNKQIGYARVVTDYAVMAYLADVFITEDERGKGYSVELMKNSMNHPKLQSIKTWKLQTLDAHGLYEKFGFFQVGKPERLMEKGLQVN